MRLNIVKYHENEYIQSKMIYLAKGVRRMRDYTYNYLKDLVLPMETVRLIGRINEYKGKQDLYK